MTPEEVREATEEHISTVYEFLAAFSNLLGERAEIHDASKLEDPELPMFQEYTPKLAAMTYGSDEYRQALADMGPALNHHYVENPHHPEHHESGVGDMTLIDLVEMFFDWWAATKRHNDGDIRSSIRHNADRFELSDQLACIFQNTVDAMEEADADNS